MHIEFKSVRIHNFLSFADSSLTIEDNGFIKVSGRNDYGPDMAVSNGSGKSSIWESIIWALTGDTIRGTKQIANLNGDDGTFVELEFSIDDKLYNIVRSKDHKVYKTNLKIMIDGKDCSGKGIRDSEKLLAEYLPDITASLLGSVIILGQGLPQKFTSNSPSGRKEVLEKLSKSDFMIEDLKKRVSERRLQLSKELRDYQDTIISLQSKADYIKKQIEKTTEQINSIDRATLEDQQEEYNSKVESLTSELGALRKDIEAKNLQYTAQSKEVLRLKESVAEDTQSVLLIYNEKLQKLYQEKTQIFATVTQLSQQLKTLNAITDTCPTCGQKLQGVEKPDTTETENKLQENELLLEQLKERIVSIEREQKERLAEVSNTAVITKESTTLTQLEKDMKELEKTLRSTEAEHNKYVEMVKTVNQTLGSIDAQISALMESMMTADFELRSIQRELLYNNKNKDVVQQHLDVISKFDTILKRDFRGYLLTTIIEFIEQRAKDYARTIFETDKISFQLEGNNIEISYLSKAYENLSGGEKQKVDLIVQFSIRDMLCAYLGFTSNILVLDEVFDALDAIGCQKVLDVITSLQDIHNIFIVTHRKDLAIPYDKEITVVKSSNGMSEIN